MKTLKEMIEVMQAAAEGKKIESRSKSSMASGEWYPSPNPDWCWYDEDYRVAKPSSNDVKDA